MEHNPPFLRPLGYAVTTMELKKAEVTLQLFGLGFCETQADINLSGHVFQFVFDNSSGQKENE